MQQHCQSSARSATTGANNDSRRAVGQVWGSGGWRLKVAQGDEGVQEVGHGGPAGVARLWHAGVPWGECHQQEQCRHQKQQGGEGVPRPLHCLLLGVRPLASFGPSNESLRGHQHPPEKPHMHYSEASLWQISTHHLVVVACKVTSKILHLEQKIRVTFLTPIFQKLASLVCDQ